jgi:hypothetical protein
MFFNAHVYFAKRVDNKLDALKVAGSMFPDFAKTRLISWDALHKKQDILAFSQFINKAYPEYKTFVQGIICHNNLDYTSHTEYQNAKPGYAYSKITPELFGLVKQALKIDDASTKSLSHNFIESGVDYYLLNETTDTVKLIVNAAREIDMTKLSKMLSVYFKKEENEMHAGVKGFFSFVSGYDLRELDQWVALFISLGESFFGFNADEVYVKKALELSLKLTRDTWREYLETSISSFDNAIKDCI